MTTVFLDQIENHFSELKKALDDNDLDSIKDITHKMKSSFRLFGLHKTGILLERIEQKAKSLDRQDLENKLQSLLNMQPRLTALVQKELNQLILLNS
jgi:HPt (histidine-containing phosphotransfer) domain-containing protein